VLLRRMAVLGTAVVVAGLLGLASSAPAGAAGYPGTTTVTSNPGGSNPGGGSGQPRTATVTIAVGRTSVVVLTGCVANSTFSLTVAGVSTGLTVTSDSSGNVTLTNAVSDPHLSVNGSTPEPSVYGSNTVILTNNSGGAGGTETVITPNASTAGLGTGSSGSGGTLAFTGADILATVIGALFLLAVGTVLVVFTRRRANHQQA
jgi:hypothetical protein